MKNNASKSIKKGFTLFLLFFLVLTPRFPASFGEEDVDKENQPPEAITDGLQKGEIPNTAYNDPVVINSDDDWANYAFDGQGGSDHPMIIEDLIIDASDGIGISIQHTGRFFEIRNCTIFNAKNGINIAHLDGTGKIYNNTIFDCQDTNEAYSGVGIYLAYANNIEIYENTISDCRGDVSYSGAGILCYMSDSNLIANNKIHDFNQNTVSNDQYYMGTGILFHTCDSNLVINNEINNFSIESNGAFRIGNGIAITRSNHNIFSQNIIHDINGSNNYDSGNGICIGRSYIVSDNNTLEGNTIFNIRGGNGDHSGNGITILGDDEDYIEDTKILNNEIYNCSASNSNYGGNGLDLYYTSQTTISNNLIANCSSDEGSDRSGCGIVSHYTEHNTVSNNVIDNCIGGGTYGGNGILAFFEEYNSYSYNNISNVHFSDDSVVAGGNGLLFYRSKYADVIGNHICNAFSGSDNTYSGNGIIFYYESDYANILNNVIENCVANGNDGSGYGILLTAGSNHNQVLDNELETETIALFYRSDATMDTEDNHFHRNQVNTFTIDNGGYGTYIDNIVNEFTFKRSQDNRIVGNFDASGKPSSFTFLDNDKWENSYLYITSPESDETYSGCGGLRFTYKWQNFGYDLEEMKLSYIFRSGSDSVGRIEYVPRPDGEIFLPWGATSLDLEARDTSSPDFNYNSWWVHYSIEDETNPRLVITHDEQEGGYEDPFALSYYAQSGDGTAVSPYLIEGLNIQMSPSMDPGTAGISISNTNAYFILRDCVVSGGFSHYGIKLQNVKHARIENCNIIGYPTTYIPEDTSTANFPLERGIYLDEECQENTIQNCIIYRTLSVGIRVDGDMNSIRENIIAPAEGNGVLILGNENILKENDIAPFGGPDTNDDYYTQAVNSNFFTGVSLQNTASNNFIEQNTIYNFPVFGIEIADIFCQANTIVENIFKNCDVNITDSGSDSHFLKINNPFDGNYYTGNNPLDDGYYSGTVGFQDLEKEEIPDNWNITGSGTDSLVQVIPEIEDLYGQIHRKVLQSNSGTGDTPITEITSQFATNYSRGTVEFWIMKEGDASGKANITFLGSEGNLFSILLSNEEFWYTNHSSQINSGQEFHDLFWYRVSLDFVDNGSFQGLSDHQYRFRIYNTYGDELVYTSNIANFTNFGNCTGIVFSTEGSAIHDMTIYLDAIGYSWSPDYIVGNNAVPGMFISQSVQWGYKNWSWVGVSLNDANITLLPTFGDVVIPLPDTLGTQSIQLFSNNSMNFQTNSSLVHFSYYFDRKLEIDSHYENLELATLNTKLTGTGLLRLNPNSPLILNLTYNTLQFGSDSYTNASVYYRVNQNSWIGPIAFGTGYGSQFFSYEIEATNYELGDTLDYYIGFQQYNGEGTFVQQYYWTEGGVFYFEKNAVTNAFHKKISPVPYQLSLNYSTFFKANRSQELPNEDGDLVTTSGIAPIAKIAFNLQFFNTTPSMTEFNAVFDDHVSSLSHSFRENSSIIYESASYPPILESNGWISPFILPDSLNLVPGVSTILVPIMLMHTNEPSFENYLELTGEALNFTFKGEKTDWFFGKRIMLEFEYYSGDIFSTIRYDSLTGILVYYHYRDTAENNFREIYFGLEGNNQKYPINLQIEMREELNETSQDFVDETLEGILYDPPGDHSYTQLSEGTSITTGYSINSWSGEDSQFEESIIEFGTGKEFDYYKVEETGTGTDFQITHTFQNTITSSLDSENSELIGPGGGDLYFGSGTYIFYYFFVNNFYFVVNDSEAPGHNIDDIKVFTKGSRIEYEVTPGTTFNVLGAHLDDVGLSELTSKNIFEDNEIRGFESGFVEELDNSPYFWSPSFVNEFSYSESSTSSSTISSHMEMSKGTYNVWSFAVEEGVGGSVGEYVTVDWSHATVVYDKEGKNAVLTTWTKDRTDIETNSDEKGILVHLEDDDGSPLGENDQFKMRTFWDKRYGSIGFLIDESATYTSYPHEWYSGDRRSPRVCEVVDIPAYFGDSVTLSAIAIDDELDGDEVTNIFKVEFYFDDDPVFGMDSILIGTQATAYKPVWADPDLFQVDWDCSLLEGEYFVFAVAYDDGTPILNSKVSSPYRVHIDNVNPSLCQVMVYPPYTNTINLYARAADEGTGISYVEYWDGSPSEASSILLGTSMSSENAFRFIWTTDPFGSDNGTHQIYARAFDYAGNTLTSDPQEINIFSSGQSDPGDDGGGEGTTDNPSGDDGSGGQINPVNAILSGLGAIIGIGGIAYALIKSKK